MAQGDDMEQEMKQKFCEAVEYYKDYIDNGMEMLNMQIHADKLIYCYEHDMHMMNLYAWILYEENVKVHVTYEDCVNDAYEDLREKEEEPEFTEFVVDEDKIAKLCENLKLQYKFMPGMLYVRTAVASWKIVYNRIKIERIYHQNNGFNKLYNRKETDGYHIQDKKFSTMEETIQYIYAHDRKSLKNKDLLI